MSTANLFYDVRRGLQAWAYFGVPAPRAPAAGPAAMRARLRTLLAGTWEPLAYAKAADKKPRGQPPPRTTVPGGHTSVQRILDGRAKLRVVET